jgi:hypothetical protein
MKKEFYRFFLKIRIPWEKAKEMYPDNPVEYGRAKEEFHSKAS